MSITVGGQTFSGKTALNAYLSARLTAYQTGDVVDAADAAILTELVGLHEDPARKIGCGIRHFEMHSNNDLNRRGNGFRIRRTDGWLEPFGYSDIFSKKTHRERVKEALATAGIEITRKFRRDAFESDAPVTCFITGQEIASKSDADAIHHSPKWDSLTSGFVAEHGGWDRIKVTRGKSVSGYCLEDEQLADLWRAHQQAHIGGLRIAIRQSMR